MKPNGTTIDFSTILASSAHDMKNSLSMLLNSLDEIIATGQCHGCHNGGNLSQISYEARRIHNSLIQLLSVFRLEQDNYEPNITHHSVYDFLEEQILNNQTVFNMRHIEATLDCSPDLMGFFDADLLAGVVSNIINNTARYSKGHIYINARMENKMLMINIEDDGTGYPPEMLMNETIVPGKLKFDTGNTGLGIYFSSLVANAHHNNGRHGYIKISNDSCYQGGGKFTIMMP